MTAPDDLYVGQWIAVTKVLSESQHPFLPSQQQSTMEGCDGMPLRILAISFPFICVTDGADTFALDMRRHSVQALKKQYVRMMPEYVPDDQAEVSPFKASCPVCGEELRQTISTSNLVWSYQCRACGFSGSREKG